MKVFKIPKLANKGTTSAHKIIGIIDASGSMASYWKWVAQFWNEYIPAENAITYTFDHNLHKCNSNRLDSKI